MSTTLKLQQWVTRLAMDLTEEGRIVRFDLMHAVEGEVAEKCHSVNMADGVSDIESTALEIMQIAEHDASTRAAGSSQRYVVAAFRSKSVEPETTFPFNLSGRRGAGFPTFGDSDPPTEKGVIGSVLRHSNDANRLVMLMANATAGALAQENDKLRGQRDKLEEQRFEQRVFMEDLLDRKEDRELEKARNLQRAKRTDELVGMLLMLAPLIVTRLLGKDAGKFVETSTLRDMSIGKLLGNLTEPEIMGVINSLEGQNRMVFLEAYRSYREEHEQKQKAAPAALQDKPAEETKH